MSVPGVGFHGGSHPLVNEEVTFAHMLKINGPVLIVGQEPQRVTLFRKMGMTAFGALTHDGIVPTQWHAVNNPGHLSFAHKTFQAVYWDHVNPVHSENGFDWLRDATKLVTPGGFLFYDDEAYIHWHTWLMCWGWVKLPFVYNGYSVWQKPDWEEYFFKRSA